jgi:hypothetical protein
MSLVRTPFGAPFKVDAHLIDARADCAICSLPVKQAGENHVHLYACDNCFAFFHMACAQTWWDEYGTASGWLGEFRIQNQSAHNCPACRAPWPIGDFTPEETMLLFLQTPTRRADVEVPIDCTLGDLKARFNEFEGIEGASDRYYFVKVRDGTRLTDGARTLAQDGVVSGTELRFSLCTTPAGSFMLIIRVPKHWTLPPGIGHDVYVRVNDTTKLSSLQKALASRLGVEESSFYLYAGFAKKTGYQPSSRQIMMHYIGTLRTHIDDLTKTMRDYDILEAEVLAVTERISTVLPDGALSAVTMVCLTGDNAFRQEVRVTSTTTVRDVKNQLAGVPPPETFTLRFEDADLVDETLTLEEYGIPPNSELFLVIDDEAGV